MQIHIVFLDIQMNGIDGVETGRVLRNTPDGDNIAIIFMSSHKTYYERIA